MKSKSLIERQLKKKKNAILVETIILSKKNPKWLEVASFLSRPNRKTSYFNLDEINNKVKENEKILIPGKILSQGKIDTPTGTSKRMKIVALSFSEKAKEKLLKSSCEISSILEEIKLNPDFKDIKILKK